MNERRSPFVNRRMSNYAVGSRDHEFDGKRGRDMKKLIKPAAIALLVFMIAFRPEPTAQAVRNIAGVLGDAANGAAQFITSLF
jgi:hypothetical protein